jgi:hypothetical protein
LLDNAERQSIAFTVAVIHSTIMTTATVATHYADMSRIPPGFFLIGFEPIPPVVNPPVHQYVPVAKGARIPATPRPKARNGIRSQA